MSWCRLWRSCKPATLSALKDLDHEGGTGDLSVICPMYDISVWLGKPPWLGIIVGTVDASTGISIAMPFRWQHYLLGTVLRRMAVCRIAQKPETFRTWCDTGIPGSLQSRSLPENTLLYCTSNAQLGTRMNALNPVYPWEWTRTAFSS